MNGRTSSPTEPDWGLLRVFLWVAEAGSLSAAAQRLGSSQPTLSRQIGQLEEQVGCALFERTQRGMRLTEAGRALHPLARRMQEQASEWSLTAGRRSTALSGTVRLTASEMVSAYLLPPVLLDLRQAHPGIQIELVASDSVENLLEREADLALRMVRPVHAALVVRHVADLPLQVYAHRDYLAAQGMPTMDTLLQHRWIGYDRSELMLRGFRAGGFEVTREFFDFRCDNQIVAWQAVRAGLGLGIGLEAVGRACPELVRVLPELPIPPLPLWLTAHRELRAQPRLRVVFDALAAALAPQGPSAQACLV